MSGGPHAGQYCLTIIDTSRVGDMFTTYQSSAQTQIPQPQRNSAEWIVENPTVNNTLGSLANFGTVTFTNTQAVINGVLGPIDSTAWQSWQVNMVSNGVIEASTSSLFNATETASISTSFTVTYGSSGGASTSAGTEIGSMSTGPLEESGTLGSSALNTATPPLRGPAPSHSNSRRVVEKRAT